MGQHDGEKPQRLLVIGGGFSGLTAAIEAAETGMEVIIVERNPYVGGRVVQHNKYFPKLCSPLCGVEMNLRRLRSNPAIKVYTMAEVERIVGGPGDYRVTVKVRPRYINSNCVACQACVQVCPQTRADEFNFGLQETKAVYLPFPQAYPQTYVIDQAACRGPACAKCAEACPYGAVELDMGEETIHFQVSAVVTATGWNPYDPLKLENLGFGRVQNVITNMMLERLASPFGPTGGQIRRPSDGKVPETVAFVQCAGSRDENHLAHCSYICCMASMKQVTYIREQNPRSQALVFYIDLRAPGRYEQFYWQVKEDPQVTFIKGKVARVFQDETGDDVWVEAEDVLAGRKTRVKVDMVVLATGMEPAGKSQRIPGMEYDSHGFALSRPGAGAVGCAKSPMDVAKSVQDATGAALQAWTGGRGRQA